MLVPSASASFSIAAFSEMGTHTADFERGAPPGTFRLSEIYAIFLT
jgi:hypothetical protein